MSRLLAFVSAFLLLAPSLFAQHGRFTGGNRGEVASTASLSIHVQMQNGRPAPRDLHVQLLSGNSVPINTAYTDQDGEVSFPAVPSGTGYYLEVTGDGIETMRTSFFVEPGETMHNEFVTVSAKEETIAAPGQGAVSVFDLNVPKDARKEMQRGDDFARKQQWLEAAHHFQKAIDKYPNYVGAYNNLGTARMNLHDPAGAKQAYEHALSIDNKYAQGWLNLATLQYFQHDMAATEQDLLKAEAVEPMNVRVLTFLAQTEFKLNKYDQAEQYAHRVHALPHKGFAMAHVIGGSAYQNQGRLADAVAEYKLYLEEAPNGRLAPQVSAAVEALQKQLTPPAQP